MLRCENSGETRTRESGSIFRGAAKKLWTTNDSLVTSNRRSNPASVLRIRSRVGIRGHRRIPKKVEESPETTKRRVDVNDVPVYTHFLVGRQRMIGLLHEICIV